MRKVDEEKCREGKWMEEENRDDKWQGGIGTRMKSLEGGRNSDLEDNVTLACPVFESKDFVNSKIFRGDHIMSCENSRRIPDLNVLSIL
jgi:hypothetical protein